MNPHNLLQCIERRGNGLGSTWAPSGGFTSRTVSPPPPPPPVVRTVAPRVAAPISAPVVPQIKYSGAPATQLYTSQNITNYDTSQILSREQLTEMIEAGRAEQQEITARQNNEDGDGIAFELEQEAANENATKKAVTDAGGGSGLTVVGAPIAADTEQNYLTAGLVAALAYFLL